MLFEPKQETFFESDEEDDLSIEHDIYGRIDSYLSSIGVSMANPEDKLNEMYDNVRRQTFSEMAKNEILSQQDSPFVLASPLASSLIIERRFSSRRIIHAGSDNFSNEDQFNITKTKSCNAIPFVENLHTCESTGDLIDGSSMLVRESKSHFFEDEILGKNNKGSWENE